MSFRKTLLRGRKIPSVLYHWSVRSRRAAIRRDGLRINRRSFDGRWKPPYVCFSDTPLRALCLCPHIPKGKVVDLYQVFVMSNWKVYRMVVPRGSGLIPEWRVFNNIPQSRVFPIASQRKNGKRLPTLYPIRVRYK